MTMLGITNAVNGDEGGSGIQTVNLGGEIITGSVFLTVNLDTITGSTGSRTMSYYDTGALESRRVLRYDDENKVIQDGTYDVAVATPVALKRMNTVYIYKTVTGVPAGLENLVGKHMRGGNGGDTIICFINDDCGFGVSPGFSTDFSSFEYLYKFYRYGTTMPTGTVSGNFEMRSWSNGIIITDTESGYTPTNVLMEL